MLYSKVDILFSTYVLFLFPSIADCMAYGWKVTNKDIISFDDNGGKKMSLQECRRQCFEGRDCVSFQAKCDVDLTVKILSISRSKY